MAKQFNILLKKFLDVLILRSSSEQTKADLRTAINFVEVADTLDAEAPKQHFLAHMLDTKLVALIRERDVSGILQYTRAKVAQLATEEDIDDVLHAISNLSLDEIEAKFPWNLLAELYREACGLEVGKKVSPRVATFNEKYAELIENMSIAFPSDDVDVNKELRKVLLWSPESILQTFKDVCKPFFSAMRDPQKSLELFVSHDIIFDKLPLVRKLPLAEYWEVQVLKNDENRAFLSEMLMQLVASMAGLPPALFGGDLITSVTKMVQDELSSRDAPVNTNAKGEPDMNEIMGIAMNIFEKIQSNGTMDNLMGGISGDSIDVDQDVLKELASGMQLPEEFQLMLDAANVNEQNIFESVQSKIQDADGGGGEEE